MRSLATFGQPHVCKGYTGILMKDAHPDEIEIIGTGDLIRNKSRINRPFKLKVEGMMERRELVPDGIIFDLVLERLRTITDYRKILYLDGFRTVDQLIWLARHGLLGNDRSTAILFTARTDVLLARAIHRRDSKPSGPRPDDEKLEENFAAGQSVFNTAWQSLEKHLRQNRIPIENVDANGDIVTTVLPQVDALFFQVGSIPIPRIATNVSRMPKLRRTWRNRAMVYA